MNKETRQKYWYFITKAMSKLNKQKNNVMYCLVVVMITIIIKSFLASLNDLENEKVAKIPNWHETLFTKLAKFILIELNTFIQCNPDRFNHLRLQIFPKVSINSK